MGSVVRLDPSGGRPWRAVRDGEPRRQQEDRCHVDRPCFQRGPCRGYTLTITSNNSSPVVLQPDGATTSYSFDSAVDGETYTFSVRARNKAGTGPAGTASASTFSPPGAPTSPSVSIDGAATAFGSARATLSWAAPVKTGGSGVLISSYEIEGVGSVGNVTSYALTGLPGGTAIAPRKVRACNDRGACGEWTTISTTSVPTTVPAAPTVTNTTPASTTEEVTFTVAAGGAGGSPITGYQWSSDAGVTWNAFSGGSFTVSKPGGGAVAVRVQAQNGVGWSTSGQQSATALVLGPPGAPSVTVSTSGAGRLSFGWTVPVLNGSEIQRYRYRVTALENGAFVTSGGQGNVDSTVLSVTDYSVQPGTYRVEVWTESTRGEGATGTSAQIVVG